MKYSPVLNLKKRKNKGKYWRTYKKNSLTLTFALSFQNVAAGPKKNMKGKYYDYLKKNSTRILTFCFVASESEPKEKKVKGKFIL